VARIKNTVRAVSTICALRFRFRFQRPLTITKSLLIFQTRTTARGTTIPITKPA
jgi:hypothetical protein